MKYDEEFGIAIPERHRCSVCRRVGPWTMKVTMRSVTAWYCPDDAQTIKERLRTYTFPAIT